MVDLLINAILCILEATFWLFVCTVLLKTRIPKKVVDATALLAIDAAYLQAYEAHAAQHVMGDAVVSG
jgi:hypothetical protein